METGEPIPYGQRDTGALGTSQISDCWVLEDLRSVCQFDTQRLSTRKAGHRWTTPLIT